jgi:hypothetical protein
MPPYKGAVSKAEAQSSTVQSGTIRLAVARITGLASEAVSTAGAQSPIARSVATRYSETPSKGVVQAVVFAALAQRSSIAR